ncbi:hypothetical protein BJG93_26740 [Paraburkholderia sprentiae WSM5005]|uniref:Fe2OG dioxygenase domain-containing protein n=1 Tax=Paraburkholderia sprentiae WSM5005 TaxID=754502 RepID=A0A1I9YT06_9BURK|nr:hypothetical protein [Paraburkholderia sprentiae]APA89347.1 hypothetical protein BJG93_26740 [Paraburkholderia sprentiae WSM5005]
MNTLTDVRRNNQTKRIRIDKSVAFKSFDDVIPLQTIAEINEFIDHLFGDTPQRSQSGATIAYMLRRGQAFRELEQSICANMRAMATKIGWTDLPAEPFHVLRCASNATLAESHCRHYDSHLLTLLIPLQLAPDGVHNGDLVMYCKPRLSVTTLTNVICKVRHGFLHSLPLSWRSWHTLHDLRVGNCKRIPVKPGSVYEFNGFALQHANLDVQHGQRRTLLIHYYDPGHSLGLSAVLRRGRIG